MKLEKIDKWPEDLFEHGLTDSQIEVARANGQLDLLKMVAKLSKQVPALMEHDRKAWNVLVDHDDYITEDKQTKGASHQVLSFLKLMFGASGWVVVLWQFFKK